MAKKILIFISGVITGAIIMPLIIFAFSSRESAKSGMTLFPEEGECISNNSFEVFQVLETGDALAIEVKPPHHIPTGITVLFLSNENKTYYDDQVINIPTGKCAKQIGTFKYNTQSGIDKTIPIVAIRNR